MKINKHGLVLLVIVNVTLLLGLNSCHNISYVSKKFNSEIILDSNYQIKDKSIKEIVLKDKSENTIVKTLNNDSVIVSVESFDNEADRNFIGESKYFYSDGKLKKSIIYNKKNLYSEVKIYHSNGKLKREDYFKDMKLIKGNCFDSLGDLVKHTEYEKLPVIEIEKFGQCLMYPDSLRKEGIEEDVILRVLINKFGKIVLIKYDNLHSKLFIEEAVRCLSKLNNIKGAIQPALIDGEPIDMWIYIPIRYRLTIFGY